MPTISFSNGEVLGVRYSSVNLNSIFNRNKKVEQHIKKEDPQIQYLKIVFLSWIF